MSCCCSSCPDLEASSIESHSIASFRSSPLNFQSPKAITRLFPLNQFSLRSIFFHFPTLLFLIITAEAQFFRRRLVIMASVSRPNLFFTLFFMGLLLIPSHSTDSRNRQQGSGIKGHIKTLVALVMENRSFYHIFGWLKASCPEIDGLICHWSRRRLSGKEKEAVGGNEEDEVQKNEIGAKLKLRQKLGSYGGVLDVHELQFDDVRGDGLKERCKRVNTGALGEAGTHKNARRIKDK